MLWIRPSCTSFTSPTPSFLKMRLHVKLSKLSNLTWPADAKPAGLLPRHGSDMGLLPSPCSQCLAGLMSPPWASCFWPTDQLLTQIRVLAHPFCLDCPQVLDRDSKLSAALAFWLLWVSAPLSSWYCSQGAFRTSVSRIWVPLVQEQCKAYGFAVGFPYREAHWFLLVFLLWRV